MPMETEPVPSTDEKGLFELGEERNNRAKKQGNYKPIELFESALRLPMCSSFKTTMKLNTIAYTVWRLIREGKILDTVQSIKIMAENKRLKAQVVHLKKSGSEGKKDLQEQNAGLLVQVKRLKKIDPNEAKKLRDLVESLRSQVNERARIEVKLRADLTHARRLITQKQALENIDKSAILDIAQNIEAILPIIGKHNEDRLNVSSADIDTFNPADNVGK